MIQIDDTLISRDLFDKKFVCDLKACKGACCIEGDSGAPLEDKELPILKEVYEEVKPYMCEKGIEAVEEQGVYITDSWDGEMVTPLVDGKECAYVVFEEDGSLKCAIEQAYLDGKIDWRKPISCHLYPIRIQSYKNYDAVNYDKWDICGAACSLGEKLGVQVYKFAKEPLIRKYGEDWYNTLEEVEKELNKIHK